MNTKNLLLYLAVSEKLRQAENEREEAQQWFNCAYLDNQDEQKRLDGTTNKVHRLKQKAKKLEEHIGL